jgi:redox-sensitive bicupin YhaK (pirin superfamily)
MPIELTLSPHAKDLGGGFTVRRSLPALQRQAVGPFVFFDHFGPVEAGPHDLHDVRPHPHIGLATVTYLFEGAMLHRDSLGSVQRIEPGAINWMTAGRGIVHSERTPDDLRGVQRRSHGLQLWAALPLAHEEAEPAFVHTPAAALPEWHAQGVRLRLLIGSLALPDGSALGSPVATYAPTLYLHLELQPGAAFELPASASGCGAVERAVYVVGGVDDDVGDEDVGARLSIDGEALAPRRLAVLTPGRAARLEAGTRALVLAVVGGAPLDGGGHRHIWWNFVSSRPQRIAQAAEDWQAGRFPPVPGDAAEFIPLPGPVPERLR